MYVAVKGGEKAIDNAHRLLSRKRRGSVDVLELSVAQIQQQMPLAVDRVMTEGSLYDPELAALAIKQASGDVTEAIFLLRAYRTTLPRYGSTEPIETLSMVVERRISATFKDIPGGQVLGPTYDYTHRLLDFTLLAEGLLDDQNADSSDENKPMEAQLSEPKSLEPQAFLTDEELDATKIVDDSQASIHHYPHILDLLNQEGLIEPSASEEPSACEKSVASEETRTVKEPSDITRDPVSYPTNRAAWLQSLVRGDEGFLLALAYSTQRGYGRNHAFAGEIRSGDVAVSIIPEELGFSIDIGDISFTECEMVNQFVGSKTSPPQFTRGYGVSFGFAERKAMAMAMVDRALRADELGEQSESPAQDQEFVLAHCDNVEAVGFVSHLKLPHYVDFQSELDLIRKMRQQFAEEAQTKASRDTESNVDKNDSINSEGSL
ncbi:MAG: carbon-phosphorus lyase complex subunit PhnI [Arenicella sp.]